MSFHETVVLGALAGFTIYVGLPFGRLQLLSERARVALAMFSVGVLAFGVCASTGEIGLATVLIVGFALHNATEGFGIVGPLADIKPSWTWLAVAGLIGGGPTFLGSILGYNVTSEPLELAFYAVS